jgi:DNA repair exonuclease SbcCD ATPase subunit
VSYYESRIKALEARIEEMAQLERMKAVKVEAQLMVSIGELQSENTRLKTEVERLTKAANELDAAWSIYENGLIETPEWVKRSQVREAVSRLWFAAKKGGQK